MTDSPIGQFQRRFRRSIPGDPQQRSEVRDKTYRVIASNAQGQLLPHDLTEEQARVIVLWAKSHPSRESGPLNVPANLGVPVKYVRIIEDRSTIPAAVLEGVLPFLGDTTLVQMPNVSTEWGKQGDAEIFQRWHTDSCLSYFITEALKTLPANASLQDKMRATVNEFSKDFPAAWAFLPKEEISLQEQFENLKKYFKRASGRDPQSVIEKHLGDRNWELSVVKSSCKALKYSSFCNDKEVVLAAVSGFGHNLQWASVEMRNNKEVVLTAVRSWGDDLRWASDALRNNKEVVSAAVENNVYAIQWASVEMRNDKEVMLAVVRGYYEDALQWASDVLRNDKEVVLAAVRRHGEALQWASVEMRNDKEVVLAAVKKCRDALQWASDALRNDKVVLAAVRRGI